MSVRRARPGLGTVVRISCDGLPALEANQRIEKAFNEIARLQKIMSFHLSTSDVSRMNCNAARKAVAVDPDTFAVLKVALEISRASDGIFDITVGSVLVANRYLPDPGFVSSPDPKASWRDIELLDNYRVKFHRSMWIDLGGIAKGYAVDRAIESIADNEPINWCVNAGGDLRVSGPTTKQVAICPAAGILEQMPLVEIANASVASSEGKSGFGGCATAGLPVDGRTRQAMDCTRFATVISEKAVIADALTKVVIAESKTSFSILKEFNAVALFHNSESGWIKLDPLN